MWEQAVQRGQLIVGTGSAEGAVDGRNRKYTGRQLFMEKRQLRRRT